MISIIIAILVVLISSAFCSMTEAALFTVPINRVRGWVKEKVRFSTHLLKIKESMNKPITTIVILNNISNIVGPFVVGGLAEQYLGKLWVSFVAGILTFLVIIFAEIIPKTIGERHADNIGLLTALPVIWLTRIFTPIIIVFEWLTKPITKNKRNPHVTEEEINIIAKLGAKTGVIEKEEETIIKNALLLNEIKVKDIMTPRTWMKALDAKLLLKDTKEELIETQYSRIPLYDESIDQITGILHKTVALAKLIQNDGNFPLSTLSSKVLFVPESKPVHKLMEELRRTQSHTAIVVDEYGGTAGLATLEDILEELVGDIADEKDSHEEEHLTVLSEDEIIVLGFTLLHEINEYFDTNLENHRTVSKLILDELNRFPVLYENLRVENLLFTVEDITPKTIEKVRVKRIMDEIKENHKDSKSES